MPRRSAQGDLDRLARALLGFFWKQNERDRLILALAAVLLLLAVAWLFEPMRNGGRPRPRPTSSSSEGYSFCTWNVENLFDDQDDPHNRDDDEDWFGRNPAIVGEKMDHLAAALLAQNDGHGPDILALVEVENRRAVELLRDALNARLPEDWRYDGLIHRDNKTGRRIEPAVLTRLPIRDDLTRTFGIRRILEAHVEVDGAPLVLLVSHWTSRIRDGTEEKRTAYADALYAVYLELRGADSAADILMSGDFNDEPDDVSVRDHLHATGDASRVTLDADPPNLLDLLAGKDPSEYGTYEHKGRWQILDHILVAPGLLDDAGWRVLPETLQVENAPFLRTNTDRRPFRFGNARNTFARGYSDHFAVTVRLRVGGEP